MLRHSLDRAALGIRYWFYGAPCTDKHSVGTRRSGGRWHGQQLYEDYRYIVSSLPPSRSLSLSLSLSVSELATWFGNRQRKKFGSMIPEFCKHFYTWWPYKSSLFLDLVPIPGTFCLRTLHLRPLYWCFDENWRRIFSAILSGHYIVACLACCARRSLKFILRPPYKCLM